eukprot:bmy_08838T0
MIVLPMVRAPIVKRKALLWMTRILMGNRVPGSCQKGCPAVHPGNRLLIFLTRTGTWS